MGLGPDAYKVVADGVKWVGLQDVRMSDKNVERSVSGDEQTTGSIDQALQNLTAINQGKSVTTPAQQTSNVDKVRAEVRRLLDQHATDLEIASQMMDVVGDRIHVFVADWKRKVGHARYNVRVERDTFGAKVPWSDMPNVTGEYGLGIAERAFDDDARDEHGRPKWKDTVAHELAHIEAYERYGASQGHNDRWTEIAEMLGADPTRTSDMPHQEKPYQFGCPAGCWSSGKWRRSQNVQRPHRKRCARCGETCVSWETGDERPTEPGTCAVDCSDL